LKNQNRSTTNLRRHLGFVHNRSDLLYDSQRKEYKPKPSSLSNDFKKELDEKLVYAITVDSRSFGDFSRPGMKSFLATAIPGYKPLHRTTIRKRICTLYKEHRRKLREILQKIPYLSLTTDVWKNNRNRHFICLTGHFYDEKLKLVYITLGFRVVRGRHLATRLRKFIEHEIKFYKIENKITSITGDNAPNIVNAITSLNVGPYYSCMGHNINLMVKSTIFPPKKKKK
jgi:hypothetical protein